MAEKQPKSRPQELAIAARGQAQNAKKKKGGFCIFRTFIIVAECAKKPHYASKQLGDRLHLPHGRGARRVAMVERPCPRDGGESRGWLR